MTFDASFSLSDVITAVMALASICAVLTTLRIYREENEPRLIAYLEVPERRGGIELVISNEGKSTARNVKLSCFDWTMVDPQLEPELRGSFIAHGIPALPPGSQRRTVICPVSRAGDLLLGNPRTQHIDYEKAGRRNKWKGDWCDCMLEYDSLSNTLRMESNMDRLVKAAEGAVKAIENVASVERAASKIVSDKVGDVAKRIDEAKR